MKNLTKVPRRFQGVLWSNKVENLDLAKDQVYIINQILAYGTLPMIKWLKEAYSQKEIVETFVCNPIKHYRASRFYLLKNYLLVIGKKLDPQKYVQNLS